MLRISAPAEPPRQGRTGGGEGRGSYDQGLMESMRPCPQTGGMARLRIPLMLLPVLLMAACATASSSSNGGTGSSGGAVTVTAKDFSLSADQSTLQPGATVTVTFNNTGAVTHSFTLDNGGGEVVADAGQTKTLTFTAPQSGTVSYHCKFHSSMTGSFSVRSSAGGGSSSSSGGASSSTSNY